MLTRRKKRKADDLGIDPASLPPPKSAKPIQRQMSLLRERATHSPGGVIQEGLSAYWFVLELMMHHITERAVCDLILAFNDFLLPRHRIDLTLQSTRDDPKEGGGMKIRLESHARRGSWMVTETPTATPPYHSGEWCRLTPTAYRPHRGAPIDSYEKYIEFSDCDLTLVIPGYPDRKKVGTSGTITHDHFSPFEAKYAPGTQWYYNLFDMPYRVGAFTRGHISFTCLPATEVRRVCETGAATGRKIFGSRECRLFRLDFIELDTALL